MTNLIAHRPILMETADRDHPPSLGLPWADEEDWREAHRTLEQLFRIHDASLDRVREKAGLLRENLTSLFPMFDRFAEQVCPACQAPCCRAARVAYDFKDLLFLHAAGFDPPPHQLRRNDEEHCRYLGDSGCLLPRVLRPFICTWYYCAPMLELFRAMPPKKQRWASERMQTVQLGRVAMETEFIRVTVGGDSAFVP
nr:hypothetical protein [uncultured Sphaerochaeta sp.]